MADFGMEFVHSFDAHGFLFGTHVLVQKYLMLDKLPEPLKTVATNGIFRLCDGSEWLQSGVEKKQGHTARDILVNQEVLRLVKHYYYRGNEDKRDKVIIMTSGNGTDIIKEILRDNEIRDVRIIHAANKAAGVQEFQRRNPGKVVIHGDDSFYQAWQFIRSGLQKQYVLGIGPQNCIGPYPPVIRAELTFDALLAATDNVEKRLSSPFAEGSLFRDGSAPQKASPQLVRVK